MSYEVTIELDFDNQPTQEDVHNYLIDLMHNGGVAYNLYQWVDSKNPSFKKRIDLGLHMGERES
jgi:hypothetical protein